MEEKKRKSGKLKEPELTPKQKELIKTQLEKENVIRSKLKKLNSEIIICVSMIKAGVGGNPTIFSMYFKDLLPVILNCLNSPLSAPSMCKLYLDLGECVFFGSKKLFGEILGNVTLRVLKPQCDLNPAWLKTTLPDEIVRTVNKIPTLYSPAQTLSGPSFCYCYPLIETSLLEKKSKRNDSFLSTGIQIISDHAKMRGKSEDDLWHPKLLLRKQMLILLIEIISKY